MFKVKCNDLLCYLECCVKAKTLSTVFDLIVGFFGSANRGNKECFNFFPVLICQTKSI